MPARQQPHLRLRVLTGHTNAGSGAIFPPPESLRPSPDRNDVGVAIGMMSHENRLSEGVQQFKLLPILGGQGMTVCDAGR